MQGNCVEKVWGSVGQTCICAVSTPTGHVTLRKSFPTFSLSFLMCAEEYVLIAQVRGRGEGGGQAERGALFLCPSEVVYLLGRAVRR